LTFPAQMASSTYAGRIGGDYNHDHGGGCSARVGARLNGTWTLIYTSPVSNRADIPLPTSPTPMPLPASASFHGIRLRSTWFVCEPAASRGDARGCANPWLLLESPGGSLDDGIELGKAVRLKRLRTLTREPCASACALVFLGGTERLLVGPQARIGFHHAART